MSDILNFRMARAPQRLVPTSSLALYPPIPVDKSTDHLVLRAPVPPQPFGPDSFLGQLISSGGASSRGAVGYVTSSAFLGGGALLSAPLRELDTWLTSRSNRAAPADIQNFLQKKAVDIVSAPNWVPLRRGLADSLIAAMLGDVDPTVRGELARLILIAGLLEAMADPSGKVLTEQDVFDHLRWRTVVLPREILQLAGGSARLARRYGFSDYFVVREEWHEYRAGEIAHIENALAGELRERMHTRTSETETLQVTDTSTVQSQENDVQTTDRLEMSQHSQDDLSIAAHVDGKVDVSASYGPTVKVDAHVGGSFDYSRSESKERATTQVQETVARAVTKIEQSTRQVRSARQLERFEEKNLHRIDNTQLGAVNVSGVYRWVDKIQRLQIFRFPHRLLLEFQVPEPATFVRWRRAQDSGDFSNPEPLPLVALTLSNLPERSPDGKTRALGPQDINETTYLYLAARYNAVGIDPPPPLSVAVSSFVELKQTPAADTDRAHSYEDKTVYDLVGAGGAGIMIPDGYRLTNWMTRLQTYDVSVPAQPGTPAARDGIDVVESPRFIVAVGQDVAFSALEDSREDRTQVANFSPQVGVQRRDITGNLPVTITANDAREFRAHLQINCERLPDYFVKWQLRTFETISAAYATMKTRHDDEKAARGSGGVAIEGDSPERNAEVVREELKRAVVRLVSNGRFPPVNALTSVIDENTGPVLDLQFAAQSAPAVQFIEQAFEWENMSYVLYPYYWAAESNWKGLADINGTDPEFARFLRSGSARVVVPARPGLEDQVRMYVDLGVLWGGGPVPSVDDPEYLSIAEEIKNQNQRPRTGDAGECWDIKLPTTLVMLDGDSTLPKINSKAELGPLTPVTV